MVLSHSNINPYIYLEGLLFLNYGIVIIYTHNSEYIENEKTVEDE